MNPTQETPMPANGHTLSHLLTSILYTSVTVVLVGIIYPLIVTLLAHLFFAMQADGSLIRNTQGIVIGSALAGQSFTKPEYFHPRPSAAGNGYDPMQSGGTNLGPTSKKLLDTTRKVRVGIMQENPGEGAPPADLTTSSASGLDPDISPESAAYQTSRVARARKRSEQSVRAIVTRFTYARTFGLFGEPRVNVTALNLALDGEEKTLQSLTKRQ